MADDELDLGVEQETRARREGEVIEPDRQDLDLPAEGRDADAVLDDLSDFEGSDEDMEEDPELAEDLRRAQTNPPQTVPQVDPWSDVDLGYLEDEDARDETETIPGPVALQPTDPFEIDEEEEDRPGRSSGPLPGQLDEDEET